MAHSTKIATCCYCGTRSALVLKESGRHELCCSACGAPLHHMKMLGADSAHPPSKKSKAKVRVSEAEPGFDSVTVAFGVSHQKSRKSFKPDYKKERKKKRRRSSFFKKAFEEIGDVLEDIFD